MQAITTKYLGPTNSRGSRVKAFSEAFPRGVTVSWDYGAGNDTSRSDTEANHCRAAAAFIKEKGWFGAWVFGATADGYVFVNLTREVEGRAFKTPHPQACDYLSLLIVRAPEVTP